MRLYETIWDYAKLESYIRSQKIFLVSEYIEDVFSVTFFWLPRRLQDFFRTCLQDVFQSYVCETSSRCLQEVFRETSCKHVLKTSWKRKRCYAEDDFRTSWRRFQQVFNTSSPRQMFAGLYWQFRCDIRGERQR